MKKAIIAIFLVDAILLAAIGADYYFNGKKPLQQLQGSRIAKQEIVENPSPTPSPTLAPLPQSHVIPQRHHTFQTFNNCGPASLSMQLSYFGFNVSQQTIGQKLRPHQNQAGIDDDKSVTLEELAKEGESYGLVAYHRPRGSIELLKRFIASDIPVVLRTWTTPTEDIGHYRLVRGYDDATGEIIQDDSLQGVNLRYDYDYLLSMWKPFNYEYLVLVPKEKIETARIILGENTDVPTAWQNAKTHLEEELRSDPDNMYALFNMSIAEYRLSNYQSSVDYFEQVEPRVPFRTLWYQIEPILAYQKVGDHSRVFEITNRILENGNRAFSELYIIRGEIYKDQGNIQAARGEFEKAVFYNKNSEEAQQALESL